MLFALLPVALAATPGLAPPMHGPGTDLPASLRPPVLRGDWEDDSPATGGGVDSGAVGRCLARFLSAELCESLVADADGGGYRAGRAGACEALAGSVTGGGVTTGDLALAELSALLMSSDDPLLAAAGLVLVAADIGSCLADAGVTASPAPPPRRAVSTPSRQAAPPPRRASPPRRAPARSAPAGPPPPRWKDGTVTFCNETETTASVATARRTGSRWEGRGWWIIEPGECHTTAKGPLGNDSFRYFAYNNWFRWSGSESHCVAQAGFKYRDSMDVDDCEEWESFRAVEPPKKAWTLTLAHPTSDAAWASDDDPAVDAPDSPEWPLNRTRVQILDGQTGEVVSDRTDHCSESMVRTVVHKVQRSRVPPGDYAFTVHRPGKRGRLRYGQRDGAGIDRRTRGRFKRDLDWCSQRQHLRPLDIEVELRW